MSDDDRKYRQRGYMDADRDRGRRGPAQGPRKPPEPHDPRIPRDPKTPNMPGFREVFRCARCGAIDSPEIGSMSTCKKCGVALHACIHCASFDSSARFECQQTIAARVSPKDEVNTCPLFAPRTRVERETGSTAPTSARSAFDDLFKS